MLLSWNSHLGTYHHRCDSCGQEFHGRKNQLYCNVKCKASHNNGLASARRSEEKELTQVYVKNVQILSRVLGKMDDDVVAIEKLTTMGFDPECPNQRIRIGGQVWYRIGHFGYRPLEESNEIELLRLE